MIQYNIIYKYFYQLHIVNILNKVITNDDDDNNNNNNNNNKIITTKSANVKLRNIFHMLNNITCSTNCKYRTAATLYTLEK